jgi:hypothetical protein
MSVRNLNEGREDGPHYEGDIGVSPEGRLAFYARGAWVVSSPSLQEQNTALRDENAALRAELAAKTAQP